MNDKFHPSAKFTPQKLNFPYPSTHKANKVSYTKGSSEVQTKNHWLEVKGKKYQLRKFSQNQIRKSYEQYLNDSSSGSSSSRESNIPIQKWQPISKVQNTEKHEVKVSESPKLSKNYVSISLTDDVDIIDTFKSKVRNWALGSKFHSLFQANDQGPKQPWIPKLF